MVRLTPNFYKVALCDVTNGTYYLIDSPADSYTFHPLRPHPFAALFFTHYKHVEPPKSLLEPVNSGLNIPTFFF